MRYNPHFNILCHLATIDDETDTAERRLIKHLGTSKHISITDIENVLKITEHEESVTSLKDLPTERKIELMIDLAEVIKKDGLQQDEDWNVLANFPKKLGFNKRTLMALLAKENTEAHDVNFDLSAN